LNRNSERIPRPAGAGLQGSSILKSQIVISNGKGKAEGFQES